MKPARSSVSRCCRSAITRRSRPRWRGGWHERALAVDDRGDGERDARHTGRRFTARRSPAFRSTRARIKPGEAFFAIKGDSRDGHDFVPAALKAGAGLAVVAAGPADELRLHAPLLIVPGRARWPARSGARGARSARRRRSSPSPARSARPAPRRRCCSRCRATARRTPRSPPTTIIGACRCRSRAVRRARAMRCSKSA